jgi:4-diphosphocytidyl-2C-methyl-D-erythritol kinase
VSEVLITDTAFSKELEAAIEQKQAKEQQMKAAQYELEKARLDAQATRVRAEAISKSPELIQQEWVKKWDGHLPQTMTGQGTVMMVTPSK